MEDVNEVKDAMNYLINILDESSFDTSAITQSKISYELEQEFLYSTKRDSTSIRDNISRKFNLQNYYPFSKHIYLSTKGEYFLNERRIGKNLNEFKENISKCIELRKFSRAERLNLVKYFILLNKHNIWSCLGYKDNKGFTLYLYGYSKDNLFHSTDSYRYLVLQENFKKNTELTRQYNVLDSKNGLLLLN